MTDATLSTIRILIVDDHPIVRQGFAQLIGSHPEFSICGTASSEREAIEIARATRPQLAVVDVTLKNSNGIDLVSRLGHSEFGIKTLVVSAHSDALYAERALEAGALGYINKQEATEKLVDAIRRVLADEVYVSDEVNRRLLRRRVSIGKEKSEARPIDGLTNRELQVFEHIGNGRTTRQIAEALHLSPNTIERYKENIKVKLGIANATELVQRATHWVVDQGSAVP